MASSSLRSASSMASVASTTSRSAATAAARLSPPKPVSTTSKTTSSIGRRRTSSQVVAAVDEKVTDWKKPSDKYSGFKYDFANSRWVRVSKDKNEEYGNKYTSENWEEGGATRVQPKSGSEYTVWPVVHALLTERGLDDVNAEEALRLQRAGKAVIVDCRPTYQFKKERIEGAISVPLYQEVQGKELWDNVKRAVCAVGLAMVATERNPNFLKDAERALGGKNTGFLPLLGSGKKIIVYCGVGGTLEVGVKPWSPERTKSFKDDPERMFGRESRSLKACYELALVGGFKGVTHLKGGLSQWRHDGYPVEGDE